MTYEKPYFAPICVRLFHRHTNLRCLLKIVFPCRLKRFLRTLSPKLNTTCAEIVLTRTPSFGIPSTPP